MDKKDKNTAVAYNIFMPGTGDLYVEKTASTQGIFLIGIISTLIGIYAIYSMLIEAGSIETAITYIIRGRLENGHLRAQMALFFGFFIFPRIAYAIEVSGRVDKHNNNLSKEIKNYNDNNLSGVNVQSIANIQSDCNPNKFIKDLEKISNLKENGVYTEDEFLKRKNDIISDFVNKKSVQNVEDFLLEIIPLKKNNVLTNDEIAIIKSSVTNKLVVHQSDIKNTETIFNAIRDSSLPVDFNSYFCGNCNNEVEINSNELNEKKFVCSGCGVTNKI